MALVINTAVFSLEEGGKIRSRRRERGCIPVGDVIEGVGGVERMSPLLMGDRGERTDHATDKNEDNSRHCFQKKTKQYLSFFVVFFTNFSVSRGGNERVPLRSYS